MPPEHRGDGIGRVHDGQGADEQRQRLFWLHPEGDGQQDGDGTGAAEAGDEARSRGRRRRRSASMMSREGSPSEASAEKAASSHGGPQSIVMS